MMKALTWAAMVLAALLQAPAHGANTTYFDNKAGYLAATGAATIGALPNGGRSNTVVGPVRFTDCCGPVPKIGPFSNEISGYEIAVGGHENFNMDIAGGATAIGFDLHEPSYFRDPAVPTNIPSGCDSVCFDLAFEITLLANGQPFATVIYNAPDDPSPAPGGPLGFFGISSSVRFDQVQVREQNTGSDDNEYFGNFLVSTVPEPATVTMLLMGLMAVIGLARRRGQSQPRLCVSS